MKTNNCNQPLPKRSSLSSLTPSTAIAVSMLAMAGVSSAATIFEENFSSSGALNGSVSASGHTWSATPTLNNMIGLLFVDGDNQGGYVTGITLDTNCTYTLSMDVNVTEAGDGGNGWFGMGFRNSSYAHLLSGTAASMLHRYNPEVQMWSQNGTNQQTVPALTGAQTISIILQTGSTLANSTVSFEVDGNQVGVSQPTNATGVDGVFFGNRDDAHGTIDNFTLTHTVPEPSSTALLGLGGLCVVLRRKRA